MKKDNKDRIIAGLGTLIFHVLMMLILLLFAFRTPLPLPGEEGVEVDLGMYNQGMGKIQPVKPEAPPAPTPTPQPKHADNKDDLVTQDDDESIALKENKGKKETDDDKKTEKNDKAEEKPVEEPKPVEKQQVNQRAIYKGKSDSQNGSSEGITGQPGDQGSPNGLTNINRYDGQGGKGNGPSYSLGGRGVKSFGSLPDDVREEGNVVVAITVDKNGNVIKAEITKGTTITNSVMKDNAKKAALNSKFSSDPNAPDLQKGTITYTFVFGKNQ